MMLIDKYLPVFHFQERHAIRIESEASVICSVLEDFDFKTSRIVRFLFWMRGMSTRDLSMRSLNKAGFTELGRTANEEIVMGLIGQFWKPAGNIRKFSAENFADFGEPHFAKAVWNFHIAPQGDGAFLLSTETRVFCTDEPGRSKFQRYWFVVKPFSGMIRMEMLKNVKRLAEQKSRVLISV